MEKSDVFFASAIPERFSRELTLPALFMRLLERFPIRERVKGKTVAIKMHTGGGLGYSTIHPFFVKLLVDHVKKGKPRDLFVTDAGVKNASDRGYTRQTIGARLVPAAGKNQDEFVIKRTGWKRLNTIQVGKLIAEADVLLNFSRVKGHGDCGFGGACKNLGMGCVSGKTRGKIHRLEGGLRWKRRLCIHCGKCVKECPTGANEFNDSNEYMIYWHKCRMCLHCMLACPTGALKLTNPQFKRFQEGLARSAERVLDTFKRGNVFHINVLTGITIFCDCWGLTTPSLVPDVGIMASEDPVAVDHASLKAIKVRNLIPGSITPPFQLGRKGRHLFEKILTRDPFVQVRALERLDAGSSDYRIVKVK